MFIEVAFINLKGTEGQRKFFLDNLVLLLSLALFNEDLELFKQVFEIIF